LAAFLEANTHNHMQPNAETLSEVEKVMGAMPVSWRRITKGYTVAERWVMQLANGTCVFVKVATDEQTAGWLRQEMRIYHRMQTNFLPRFLGWCEGPRPVVILEDLSEAIWTPCWTSGQIDRVLALIAELDATKPPPEIPDLTALSGDLKGWQEVADNPSPFLGLGMVSAQWLCKSLPALVSAEKSAMLGGGSLVHLDIRSDNVCFHGERTLLVDWNWAHRGNSGVDLVFWLPTLHAEGGPPPWEFAVDEPALIAMVAGYFAAKAPKPAHAHTTAIRQLQLDNLRAALPWVIRALDLPAADPPMANS
jgi:hypothetical protein